MFSVITCMFGGIAFGWLIRNHDCGWSSRAVTLLIWLLLFLLGVEVGGNRKIIASLPELGLDALTITLLATAGSCIFAWVLWKHISKRK